MGVYKATDSTLPNSIEEPPTSPTCVSPLHKKSFGDEFSSTPHKNNTISNGYDNIFNAVERDVSLHDDLTEEKKRVIDELFNFQQRQALHSRQNLDANSSKSNQSKLSNLKGKRSKSSKAASACERKKRSRLNKTVDEKQEENERSRQCMQNLRQNQSVEEKQAENASNKQCMQKLRKTPEKKKAERLSNLERITKLR